jgi:DNA adenine methylase
METTSKESARVLRYPGSKWGLARQLVSLVPEHERYLEPFFGSGAAFFAKPRAAGAETVNDSDGEVYNLFSLLRDGDLRERLVEAVEYTAYAEDELLSLRDAPATDDPVEHARRLLVRSWQDFAGLRPHGDSMTFRWAGPGTQTERPARVWARLPERISVAAQRLKDAQVIRRDAVEVIEAHRDPRVLVYADPPYIRATRTEDYYEHETDDAYHERLLGALLRHPGPVVLSGYASALYDDALCGWERHELLGRRQGMRRGRKGYEDTEIVWRNPAASGHAGDPMRPLFDAG